jgi:hypothetical protein
LFLYFLPFFEVFDLAATGFDLDPAGAAFFAIDFDKVFLGAVRVFGGILDLAVADFDLETVPAFFALGLGVVVFSDADPEAMGCGLA